MPSIFDQLSDKQKNVTIKPSDVHQDSPENKNDNDKPSIQKIEVINNVHFDEITEALIPVMEEATTARSEIASFIKIYSNKILEILSQNNALYIEEQEDRRNRKSPSIPAYFLLSLLVLISINIGIGVYLIKYNSNNNNIINYDKVILSLENRISELEEIKKGAQK
jgi:hypothetical protein